MNQLNLYNAPRYIGDYAIRNKKAIGNLCDLMNIVVEMERELGIVFVFSSDMWMPVLAGVLKYQKIQIEYLDICIKAMEEREGNDKKPLAGVVVNLYKRFTEDKNYFNVPSAI